MSHAHTLSIRDTKARERERKPQRNHIEHDNTITGVTSRMTTPSHPRAVLKAAKQYAALDKALAAAKAGKLDGLVEGLFMSYVLDGLAHRIRRDWPSIPQDELDRIIAEAVDALHERVSRGGAIRYPVGYLYKAGRNKAADYIKRHVPMEPMADEDLEDAGAKARQTGLLSDGGEAEERRAAMRREAIALTRSLLPRLGQDSVQRVMSYVLDAVEDGGVHLSNVEIADAVGLTEETVRQSLSRARRRLERIVREEGLAPKMKGIELDELVSVDTGEESQGSDGTDGGGNEDEG